MRKKWISILLSAALAASALLTGCGQAKDSKPAANTEADASGGGQTA